jgi:hypothetical protein
MVKFNNQSLAIVPRTQGSSVPPPLGRTTPPGGLKKFKIALNKDIDTRPYLLVKGAYIDDGLDFSGRYYLQSGLTNEKPFYKNNDGTVTIFWRFYPDPPIEERPGFWTIGDLIDSQTLDGNSPESNVWNVYEWFLASGGYPMPITITRVGL